MESAINLTFYFDVLCPFAWRTSIWIRRVAKERPVRITWKQFSLAAANDADPSSQFMQRDVALGRTFILAGREGGDESVDRLYRALGDVIHGRGEDPTEPAAMAGALAAAGLAPDLHDRAMADQSTEQDYWASHEEVLGLGGFGVPTLVLEGSDLAYFGPVVDPVPDGAQALELWDYTHWALRQANMWEFKRQRHGDLARQFSDA
ncbi:MAG: DsbA family protein [Chloroflexi bacterium]|nr:DsbA family protein [Chloroflexota bacterium]